MQAPSASADRAPSSAAAQLEPRILHVPYEDGAYWRKGAKDGPAAIQREFLRLREFSLASKRSLPKGALREFRSVEIAPYSRRRSLAAIQSATSDLVRAGHAPVLLGGDHSITLPVIRALASEYGAKSFAILHIDAHSDTFDAVDGFDFHHGSVFRNIVEEELVEAREVFQLGLRGPVRGEGLTFADARGIPYVLMSDFRRHGAELSKFVNTKLPLYVSFDIDAIDPAYAPGTGTPVPGGFSSSEALDLVRQIGDYDVIGMDLVEVAPAYDVGNITALLGAHILFESLVNFRFSRPQAGG